MTGQQENAMPGDQLQQTGTTAEPATPGQGSVVSADTLQQEMKSADRYVERSRAANTHRAYEGDWRRFEDWCRDRGLDALSADADMVAVFLAWSADQGLAVSTVRRRLAAIRWTHAENNRPVPAGQMLSRTMSGIAREYGEKPARATPLDNMVLRVILDGLYTDLLRDARDAALLLTGFGAALRRSELASLHLGQVEWKREGLVIHLGRSKTDQTGKGHIIGIPEGRHHDAGRALRHWLKLAGIRGGPLFRSVHQSGQVGATPLSDAAVNLIIKKRVAETGRDPEGWSGHSLRRGWITTAARLGISTDRIMRHSRHRDIETVMGYIDEGRLFDNHAGSGMI